MVDFFRTPGGFDQRYNFATGAAGGMVGGHSSGYYHQMAGGMQYMNGMSSMYGMPTPGFSPSIHSNPGMFSIPAPSIHSSIVSGATA